jgi:hypothetical protein
MSSVIVHTSANVSAASFLRGLDAGSEDPLSAVPAGKTLALADLRAAEHGRYAAATLRNRSPDAEVRPAPAALADVTAGHAARRQLLTI